MKKLLSLLMVLLMALLLFTGCSQKPAETSTPPAEQEKTAEETPTEPITEEPAEEPDVVATASMVTDAEGFKKAIAKDGTWIICPLNDITINEELVVEGEFYNKDDATQDLYRKLGLYAQDADHNVTERYTVIAPKLTIKSPNTKIQGGTFVGDTYIEANGFSIQDATVDGNIYFSAQEYKDSFVLVTDAGKEGKITGKVEVEGTEVSAESLVKPSTETLKEADAVSSATDATSGATSVSTEPATETSKEADAVSSATDAVSGATPASSEAAAPVAEVPAETVDIVSTASMVTDAEGFKAAITENGRWIICPLNDISINEVLVVEGTFYNKDDTTSDIYRKLGFYAQDENHTVTERYTVTAPRLVIKSPNTRIQGGTFVGDVYVEANGFSLQDATIQGNLYFTSQEYMNSCKIVSDAGKEGEVTGTIEVSVIDVVSTASMVTDAEGFKAAITENGRWIICPLNDITIDEVLVVEGTFFNKDDITSDIYRKLGLYAQDENHTVTERYTVTAPKMIIKSPNTKIQGGTFVGNVYVEANGFSVQDATVQGNIYFASQEFMDSCVIVKDSGKEGIVTGTMEVSVTDVVSTASMVTDAEGFKAAITEDGRWIICPLNDIAINEELVVEGTFYNKDDKTSNIYRKLGFYAQDENHTVTERYIVTAPKITIKSPNTRLQGGTFVGDVYVDANGFSLQDATIQGNLYFTNQVYKDTSTIFTDEGKAGTVTGTITVITE